MKESIIILLAFCFLASCQSSRNENVGQVYVIDVDEAQEKDFYFMFDTLAYIPLETIDDNEIGQIDRILYHEGKYIIADRLTNTIFVYLDNGRYYSKIETIGNGPGEYVQITDIAINKFDTTIKVLDAMQGKIVSYDLKGRFLKETELPVFPSPLHFCLLDSERYAFDFQRCSSEKEWQYNLCIGTEDFTGKINKFLPYDKSLDVCFSPRITLQDVNGDIVYTPLYSSTVYTITDSSEIKPRYTFDFGDKWVNKDFIDTRWKDALEFMNKLGTTNFVYYFNLLESGSHIYAEFMHKENKYHLVIDKATDHMYLQRETDAYRCHYTEIPMCSIGNEFVIPVSPLEYNSMVGENAVQLAEDSNPVLMLGAFKTF